MKGFGTNICPGCSYDLHTSSWNKEKLTAMFFATFHGTHTSGGPVEPSDPPK